MAATLANDNSRSHQEKISELYLRAFSRHPSSEELHTALDYLNRKQLTALTDDPSGNESPASVHASNRLAYEDIIWALINTKEFLFNH